MEKGPVFSEASKEIPISYDVDVCVVGAGSAGIGAAVKAAQEGAKVLLIEKTAVLGGTWTSSLQSHITSISDGKKVFVHGLLIDLLNRLHKLGAGELPEEKHKEFPGFTMVAFEAEWMKCVLDDIVTEAGVNVLFHTMCVDAVVENAVLKGVIIENKSGRQFVRSKVVIDCSGDADIVHFSGAPYKKGRDKDGQCQPINTVFQLSNVNQQKAVDFVTNNPGILIELSKQAIAKGELDGQYIVNRLGSRTMYPDVTYHNMGHILNIDITNANDLSKAEIIGRRQVRDIYNFFRKYVPGYESCRLAVIAACTGLRESRRIVGEYTLKDDDFRSSKHFDDGIARHHYRMDVHSSSGIERDDGIDVWDAPDEGTFYEVPYRCLIPLEIEQLLVAGRCISAERGALGSARTTACCVALGEAAGLAATHAVKNNCFVRNVDGATLKRELFLG